MNPFEDTPKESLKTEATERNGKSTGSTYSLQLLALPLTQYLKGKGVIVAGKHVNSSHDSKEFFLIAIDFFHLNGLLKIFQIDPSQMSQRNTTEASSQKEILPVGVTKELKLNGKKCASDLKLLHVTNNCRHVFISMKSGSSRNS